MSKPRQQSQVGRAMVYAGGLLALVGFGSCKILARDHPGLALWGSLALLVGGPVAIVGKMISPREADTAMEQDNRPPILFLRPFVRDHPQFGYRLFRQIFLYGGYFQHVYTHEEIFADIFSGVGPFVALGKPGEGFATPGAARKYLTVEDWEGVFEDWLGRASLVVVNIGTSDSLLWEIERVVRRNQPYRTVLYVPGAETFDPEEFEEDARLYDPREQGYRSFREKTSSIFPQRLPEYIGPNMFIWFDERWNSVPLAYQRITLMQYLIIAARTRLYKKYVETFLSVQPIIEAVHGVTIEVPGAQGMRSKTPNPGAAADG